MHFELSQLTHEEASRRRHRVIRMVLLFTLPAAFTMADLHWRTGYDLWKVAHLLLFTLLLILIALGASQSLIGYLLHRRGGDPCRIADTLDESDLERPVTARTAVVMPIFNEEVARVIEGIRAVYLSAERTGRLAECDFFLLSDSNDPNCWIAEEAAWLALTRELGASGRIFYRKRRMGINKKSGNIADFCRRWGKLYRYMVVLDADSIMTGDAILRLVQLMERNPRVGIIQGVPLLANGGTILARLQQFAGRLYGPISAAGLNYWQLGEANYWGHNAVLRLAPFIRHCSLPELPGDGPFGGRILSHDYVEAALMRRAGWAVWLATGIEGNYEECPPTVIDLAERDRRWLQGNLQHSRLVFARGFHAVNRIHFMLGILSYLASPLWLAFLAISVVIAEQLHLVGVSRLPMAGFASWVHWSYEGEALALFGYTLALLFLPKALALLDLRGKRAQVESFGGWEGLLASVTLETSIFTLLAPVLMLFHSWFIGGTLLGERVSWGPQRRGGTAEGDAWAEAFQAHGAQTIFGILVAALVVHIDVHLALWMSPILLGLIFSIPLSYITGSRSLGLAVQRSGLFDTMEETRPLPELRELAEATAARQAAPQPPKALLPNYGMLQAVLDPYVNAVHVSFLRARDEVPASGDRFAALREILMREGPEALKPKERTSILMDAESMHLLHRDVWAAPASRLAAWWRNGLAYYTRLAPAPRTAFSK